MSDHTAPADPDDELVIVPTLKGFVRLHERVQALEDEPAESHADVQARLDRHRRDIDEIKSRWNDLIRYLNIGPTAAPTSTPEQYQ